jgi:hypothetical protein
MAEEDEGFFLKGIEDTLRKEGADQDFIEGFKKEAFLTKALPALWRGTKGFLGGAASRLGRGLEHAVHGGLLGGGVAGLPGAVAGAGVGLAGGSLGYGRAGLLGAGVLGGAGYLGTQALKGAFGDSGNDMTGNPADRNRAVPFASNKASGAVGGALIGSLLANEMGMDGGAAMLMPVLGGLAGYNYMPQMMDKWKDPYGYGVNSISPSAASMHRSFSLM